VRVGLIGAGGMGQVHAQAWRAAGADVAAVFSSGADSASRLAAQVGARAVSSVAELLETADVVDVCTPTPSHLEYTLLAASAGKHVVCEKPIALRLEDASAMIEACQTANIRLFIAHVVRFFPQYRAAQETVSSGQIGDLGVIRLKRAAYEPRMAGDNWFLDESKSGGLIVDLMIHDFDYARWLGGEVERVHARSARATMPSSPSDYALVTLRFKSGAMALIEGGWAYPKGVFRTSIDIAGTDGLIEWNSDASGTLRPFLENTALARKTAPDGLLALPDGVPDVGLPLGILAEDPYETQIRHVKHALETNAPFLVTPQDALEALRIALAARMSLQTGRTVKLEEVR
jgi:predicted dehydrogenase